MSLAQQWPVCSDQFVILIAVSIFHRVGWQTRRLQKLRLPKQRRRSTPWLSGSLSSKPQRRSA